MKKQFIYFIALIFMLGQALNAYSLAASPTPAEKIAIQKYKAGNYTGCLQDCENIVYYNPSDAIAYYYMAMSYSQAGQRFKAISAYSKVLSLNPNSKLADYATTGIKCLEGQCKDTTATGTTPGTIAGPPTGNNNPPPNIPPAPGATGTANAGPTATPTATPAEIDRLIAAPNSDGLSKSVKQDLEQKRLDALRDEINNNRDVKENTFRKLNDASQQVNPTSTTAEAQKKPTNDEIAAATKVLQDAGITTPQLSNYQSPQQMQVEMLSALNNPVGNSNDSNSMLNMIPSMMAQSKTGQGNYSPEIMQAFIMNSLTGNMNLNLNNDENSSENY